MKTFETEKHNIPEGATHYRDECEEYEFSYVKFANGSMNLWDDTFWSEVEDYFFKFSVKPIPQTNIEALEEEGVEREELEAAYDLYCTALSENKNEIKSFEHFKSYKYKQGWLAIVRKTGYRKES